MAFVSLAAILMLLAPVPAAGPMPEHTVVVVLRDYVPSNQINIKQGESLRFVDGDPTAGPGHPFTQTVPPGGTPRVDSPGIPLGTLKDRAHTSAPRPRPPP